MSVEQTSRLLEAPRSALSILHSLSLTQPHIYNYLFPSIHILFRSGKTFTMLGPDGATQKNTDGSLLGIIPRAVKDLFRAVDNNPTVIFTVEASYAEIYREEIRDLLASSRSSNQVINIRQQSNGDVTVDGVVKKQVNDLEAVMKLLKKGNTRRQVGGHALNAHSSRSHAVFTLYVSQATMKGGRGIKLSSKFNLIDLAGSERAKRTGATGARLKEGSSINQSLSALGNVIKVRYAAGRPVLFLFLGVHTRRTCSQTRRSHSPYCFACRL